ncbi:MAG: nucleotide disphospho-sugar-binding domain-containing protein [Actinomycetes bacterium]
MTDRPLTILFMPESAYGPTNQCVGIGKVLLERGHRVVFAAEASWKGRLSPLGFEEDLVDLAPPEEPVEGQEADAGAFWKDYIREIAPVLQKPTIDQLEGFMQPTWQALIDGSMYCEPHLKEIIARVQPDVIVEDNVVAFPALLTADAPYVRIVSCNPLEVKGPDVAPTYSGLPADDRSQWDDFRAEYDRSHRAMWEMFNAWVVEKGAPPLDDLEFVHTSEVANLYVFPEDADYVDRRPLDATWHRMDSSVRETDDEYELPELLRDRPDGSALIYFSLGSLGGADVDLMRRVISVLADTPHRYIVSKGPQAGEIELPANMVGAEFLPQTTIIPKVDLVITHGGNNTTTESLHFGKPMILLPLFWDQHDNAQRMDELGFGVRLSTYTFTDAEMHGALETLLNDADLRDRLAKQGEAIRARNGMRRGADVIESVGRAHAERT